MDSLMKLTRAVRRLSLRGEYAPHAKQREFHAAGGAAKERLFLAGNRVGKTLAGAAEVAFHLTGRYPEWWDGVRFEQPVRAWAASVTREMTRDILQEVYIGNGQWALGNGGPGGIVPKEVILGVRMKGGLAGAVDSVRVRHARGGVSTLSFKSFDQGRMPTFFTPAIDTTHGVSAEQWSNEVFSEYLGQNPFFTFMGTGSTNIIQVKEELTKAPGDAITVQLRARLTGTGVGGNVVLKGAEEDLVFHEQRIVVDTLRHAVALRGEMSEKRAAFDLRNQAREALVDWASNMLMQHIVGALTDSSNGRVRERYMYGATDANWHATHVTAMANVDATNDKLTTAMISKAKRKALLEGDRKVRPFMLKDGNKVEEVFVLFAHPYAVRDLLGDADFKALNTYIPTSFGDSVLVHGQRYKGMWDGVMIFEAEVPMENGMGASGIDISHNVLCGAQACAVAYGKRTNYKEDVDDYGHANGFAIDEIRGVEKLVFDGADHGVVHVFSAAVAD